MYVHTGVTLENCWTVEWYFFDSKEKRKKREHIIKTEKLLSHRMYPIILKGWCQKFEKTTQPDLIIILDI